MIFVGALVAAAVLVWVAADPRRAAFALAFTVGSNASGVLETRHGVQGFLLPLALLALGACLLRWIAGGWRFEPRVATVAGVTVVCLLVVSAAAGPFVSDTPQSSAEAVSLLMKHLVVLAAVVATTRSVAGLRAALYGLVAAGSGLSLLTVYQVLTGRRDDDLLGFGAWSSELLGTLGLADRAAGPFGDDPNTYAMYLVVMLGAAIGLVPSARHRATRRLLVVAAAMMTIAILATSSRTGLVAAGVVALVVVVTLRLNVTRLAIGAAVLAAVLLNPMGPGDRLATLSQVPDVTSNSVQVDAGLRGRTSEMLAAWQMFVDHPVSGVGYGTFNDHYLDYSRAIGLDDRLEPRSAHSLPLEIAAEQGLVGLAAWGLIAAYAAVAVVRLRRGERPEWLPLGLALVGFAVSSLFLHDVHPRLMWTLIGMTIGAAAVTERARGRADLRTMPHGPLLPSGHEPRRPLVAMLIQNYLPAVGGAERQLATLMPALVGRGIEPVVITRSMPGQPAREEIGGAQVVRIDVWGPKPLRSLLYVVGARIELGRIRPDVVHAFDAFTPSTIAIGHARRHGAAAITKLLRSGDLGDLRRLERKPLGGWRLDRLLAHVDTFVVISSDIERELDARGVPPDRRAAIPNGVDTHRFRPRASDERLLPESWRDGDVVVVATGRLASEKRLVEIASRWRALRSGPLPWARLVVVGDGPERDRLAQMEGVDVLGWREDVERVLRSSDIYVSASAAEGLSNSLLEAMACGLPCVVTDVGGVRDVVTSGRDGIVVDADDLDGLVSTVARIAHSPQQWRVLGRSARARATETFALDRTADDLVSLYRRLTAVGDDMSDEADADEADAEDVLL